MDLKLEKEFLRTAVSLNEAYLAISPESTRPAGLVEALERVVAHRLAFLEGFGRVRGFDVRQGRLEEAGSTLLEADRPARQGIHVEYELSFFGINPQLGERFRPTGLKRLSSKRTRHNPIRHIAWAADCGPFLTWDCDPAGDLAKYEDSRWRYSVGKYADTEDLNDIMWYSPDHYTDLREELTQFLDGRTRVLEVGFLHQRIQTLIHEIDPNIEYHGVDIGIPAVQQARERGLTVFNSNAWYSLPYPDRYFDGIVSTTVQAGGLFPNTEWLRVLSNNEGIFNVSLQ